MENFLSKMQNRYTVKKYNPNGKISEEQIEKLKKILHLSPSSINSQPWKFTFVTNKETKEKLADASYFNKEKINDSNILVVFQVLKDPKDFENQVKEFLPEVALNYYNTMLKPKGEQEVKNWMSRQVYISLGVLLSACAEMEIDSTPMEGIETEKYDAILNNEKYTTLFSVALGEKDEEDFNRPSIKPKFRLNQEIILEEI